MILIRRLHFFDYPKLKRLISYLCTENNTIPVKGLAENFLSLINAIMPLSMKFKSESFILIDDKEILGLITVCTTAGNPYKINITRLIFKENRYEIGKSLVDFVVQKLGGKGATSFSVVIDECHNELFDLFINGCGFRQCSSETIWKIEKPTPHKTKMNWRYAQSSDAEKIAELFNDEIINIYKPSLLRTPNEFKQPFFQGFTDFYKTRYIIEETNKILGYFSITTADNINYILDITTNNGYNFDYDKIINALLCEIASKKHAFYAIIKQKKYTKSSENFENYLKSKKFNPIQTRQILVKDFYRPRKDEIENQTGFILWESQVS